MRLRRRYAMGLAIGLAGLMVAAVPVVASATGGTFTVSFAGNSPGNPDVLEVDATAPTAITTLSAELLSGSTVVYSANLTQQSAGSDVWTVAVPATVTLGIYTVSVSLTDSAGDSLTVPDAGTFSFLDQPTLTATPSPLSVSYGSQSITFSGSLTAVPPAGGAAIDEADQQIYYQTVADPTPVPLATTSATGTYQGTVPDSLGGTYTLSAASTETTPAVQSSQVVVPLTPNATKVTASAGPAYLAYGRTATLHGQAVYATGTGFAPLASSPLEIVAGSTSLGSVTTDSNGDYSTQVPTTDGMRFTVKAGAGNPLLSGSTAVAVLPIRMPLKSLAFKAALQPDDTVASSICIRYNASAAAFGPPRLASIDLEYAPRPGGPWRSLGLLRSARTGPDCSSYGLEYLTDAKRLAARLANAYYRAVVESNRSFEPFTSRVVHSALDPTRITGFLVHPTTITSGQSITVRGVLSELVGHAWRPYAHRSVGIFFFNKSIGLQGSPAAVTGANGAFQERLQFTGSGKAQMFALYAGDKAHLQAASKDVRFTVVRARRHGAAVSRSVMAGAQFGPRLKA